MNICIYIYLYVYRKWINIFICLYCMYIYIHKLVAKQLPRNHCRIGLFVWQWWHKCIDPTLNKGPVVVGLSTAFLGQRFLSNHQWPFHPVRQQLARSVWRSAKGYCRIFQLFENLSPLTLVVLWTKKILWSFQWNSGENLASHFFHLIILRCRRPGRQVTRLALAQMQSEVTAQAELLDHVGGQRNLGESHRSWVIHVGDNFFGWPRGMWRCELVVEFPVWNCEVSEWGFCWNKNQVCF